MNLKDIIKSRFIKGENLPSWYEKRLEICSVCPKNSKNIESKSNATKGWELIAGAHCVSCGCTVTEKTKLESSQCPENKWFPIAENYNDEYKIFNLQKDKTNLSYNKETKQYTLHLGHVKVGNKAEGSIFLEVGENDIKGVPSFTSSCGCTKPTPVQLENGYRIDVNYKNVNRVGDISQSIKIQFTNSKNKPQLMIVLVKGKIIN